MMTSCLHTHTQMCTHITHAHTPMGLCIKKGGTLCYPFQEVNCLVHCCPCGRVFRDAELVQVWCSLELEGGELEKQGGQVGLLQGKLTKQPVPFPSHTPHADNPLQRVCSLNGLHVSIRAKLLAS